MTYEPELGQAVLLVAALWCIEAEMQRVYSNRTGRSLDSPFQNTGRRCDLPDFSVHAYSWNDEEDQPWNFKCGDIEVSWYKYCGRGTSVNRQLTNDEISAMLDKCLTCVRALDVKP